MRRFLPSRAVVAALLAGGTQTLSFAPFGGWWLQIVGVAWLAALLDGATPRRAATLGLAFGSAWLVSTLWWLVISMHVHGHLPLPLAVAAMVLLCVALSAYLAGAAALAARLRGGGVVRDATVLAACWLLAELARAQWFTGFPWGASGYAHTDGPLAGYAPWLGVYGIGALGAWAGALLGLAARRARARGAAVALAAVAIGGGLTMPSGFTTSTGRTTVSLWQPAIPQELKFDPERLAGDLQAIEDAIANARGRLVVTPESVVPLPWAMLDAEWRARVAALPSRTGRAFLVGTFLGDEDHGWVNSVRGFAPPAASSSPPFDYGKRHLLPFGEFIPPGFGWFVRALAIPLGDQAVGTSTAAWDVAGQRWRVLICYEDLFGEDFAASAVGRDAATVFVNVSNLAWFGRWMVQDQHLQFSRMRALEFERPFVRSTNTGATAVVDHRGRVTHRLPPEVRGTLEATVEGRIGSTPYARWLQAWGLAPWWAVAVGVLAAAFGVRRRAATVR